MKILTSFYIALKRTLKNPLFLVMLAFLCFCVLFFGSIEKDVQSAPIGITHRDSDPNAIQLVDNMVADGFILFSDEKAMCEAIRQGDISIGIAVKEGLTPRLEKGKTEGALVLYCMPTASFIKVTSLRVSAHLGQVYTPYIVQHLMEYINVDLPAEQVREYMAERLASDANFEISVTDMEGVSLESASYSRNLIFGMLAVLLFCLFALCTCTEKDASFRSMHDRLGCKKAFFAVLLPGYAVKYAITLLVSGGAVIACKLLYGTDVSGLAVRCAVYLLFLCGVGAMLYAILYRFSRVQLYIMLLSLLSLAVCPIFVDIGMFSAVPEWIRLLLPPFFFYKIPQAPVACAIAAGLVCVGGLTALYFRESKITPRTRM